MALAGDFVLHTYFRSSCSARLRIALALKNLSYESVPVNLLQNEQLSAAHKSLNPSSTVPVLIPCEHGRPRAPIGQSMAALEYLEESFPAKHPLLPPQGDFSGRAHVRSLANIIACDTQPVTNLRILKRVKRLGGEVDKWAQELMAEGLAAYEAAASEKAGKYSYGNNITMADICLVPAIWGAQRYGVDLNEYPTIVRVFELLSHDPAVVAAHWKNQADCPVELRG